MAASSHKKELLADRVEDGGFYIGHQENKISSAINIQKDYHLNGSLFNTKYYNAVFHYFDIFYNTHERQVDYNL